MGGIAHLQSQGEGEAANFHRPVPQGFEPWTSGSEVQHSTPKPLSPPSVQVRHEEQLPAEFRRRLHEWERKQREGSGRRKRTDDAGQPDVRRKLPDGERRRGKQEYREHGAAPQVGDKGSRPGRPVRSLPLRPIQH